MGCGGFLVWRSALEAHKTRRRHEEDRPDRLAQLRKEVETYRAEVADLADRMETWFRRVSKRQEREDKAKANPEDGDGASPPTSPSTGFPTGFPQGPMGGWTKDQLRAYARALRFTKR